MANETLGQLRNRILEIAPAAGITLDDETLELIEQGDNIDLTIVERELRAVSEGKPYALSQYGETSFGLTRVYPEGRMRFGLDTDIARYARRVDSLMTRIGIDSGANPYILHSNIADHIKEKHGLAVYNKGEEEAWRELYMKYWMLNEHSLITDSMREFMKGKTLVHIDIDLPTVWNSQELSEYFGDRWWEDRSKQNPLVDLIRKQVLAKYQSYVVAGGRSQSEETMAQAIECILSRTINKYTFFAIVRKDYLERSVA